MTLCKYTDCILRTVNPEICRECAENYQTHYLQKAPQFCPFCGYHHIVPHHDGTATCAKCHGTFSVNVSTGKGYQDEKWYDIPGCDGYQVSNYLRIYGKDRKDSAGREISGHLLSVYRKKNELYVSLSADGKNKEYNVRKLYQAASKKSRNLFFLVRPYLRL